MTNVTDALYGKGKIGSVLKAGIDMLAEDQDIVFVPYVRLVLPLDGYVFWVKASELSASSAFNSLLIGGGGFNKTQSVDSVPANFIARGSLHYASDSLQTEEANYSRNRVIFTSEVPIQDMNAVNSNLLYIATFDGPNQQSANQPAGTTAIRFAFSSRGSYFEQADTWHYVGFAIFPFMATQIIDDPRTFASQQLIVSDSLPAWLRFASYLPPWAPVNRPLVQFYPSFVVPDNIAPPYVAVHIEPNGTNSMQAMPFLDVNTNQYQLASDRVTLTLYGCNNDVAQSLLYCIMQYTLDQPDTFGIMNMPVVQDEKEGQNELNILAQKKRIRFDVSYNQSDVRNIARQLITSSIPTVQVGDEVIPFTNNIIA